MAGVVLAPGERDVVVGALPASGAGEQASSSLWANGVHTMVLLALSVIVLGVGLTTPYVRSRFSRDQ